jgi:hypothetical protein
MKAENESMSGKGRERKGKMQEEKGNKDIGIHESPPIDMKIT